MSQKTEFNQEDYREFELVLVNELKYKTFTINEANSFLDGWILGKGYSEITKGFRGFLAVIARQGNSIEGQL